MSLDHIEFDYQKVNNTVKIQVIINGTVVLYKAAIDWVELLCGSFNSTLHCIQYSTFFPFSSKWGDPAGFGIYSGILVKSRKHTVEWRVNPDEYRFLPKRCLKFNKIQYTQALVQLFLNLKSLPSTVLGEVSWYDDNYNEQFDFHGLIRRLQENGTIEPEITGNLHLVNNLTNTLFTLKIS